MNELFGVSAFLVRQVERGVDSRSVEGGVVSSRVLELVESFSVLLRHLSVKGLVITSMLLLIVLLSAVGVVYSSHLSRQLFAEQAILLERNDQMQLEWAQLLLEQSAWSSPNRIESVAGDRLDMEVPKAKDIQLIY